MPYVTTVHTIHKTGMSFQKEIMFKRSDDILEQTTIPPNPVVSSKRCCRAKAKTLDQLCSNMPEMNFLLRLSLPWDQFVY